MGGGGGPVGGGGVDSKPNGMTFVSIAVVMMGAAMFGADQNNYGVTYGFQSFQDHWSCDAFKFADKDLQGKVISKADCNGELVDASCIPSKDNECMCQFDCNHVQSMKHPPSKWASFIVWGLNLVTAGMMIGALTLAPVLSKCLGRRMTISIGGLMCFFGCVLVAWIAGPAHNVPLYYIGRFLTGFGCGVACMVLPMYNAEVATLNIRGLTGSLFQFMVVIGGVVVVVLLGVIDSWSQGFLIPGYFGLAVGLGAWACPESPRYLMDNGKKDQAIAALKRVRTGDVTEEIEFIEKCLDEEKKAGQVGYMELFTTPGLRFRLFVACYLQAAQQLTGVNAFLGFQSDIFKAGGYKEDQINNIPDGPAFIVQMVFIVGCITGLALIDSPYGGRKLQLLGASFFMGPPLLIAAFTRFADGNGQIVAIMVFIFSFGFQAAWGIIPWFYPAELFQMKERERALSVSTFCGFLFNLLVGMVTKALYEWSPGGMFLIFGLLNVSNCIFVAVCMQETKGKSLEEIPAMFDGPSRDSKTAPLNDGER